MTTLLIVLVVVVIVAVLVVKFLPRMRAQAAARRGHGAMSHRDRGGVLGSPATYDPATPLEDRYPEDNRV